jgi:PIN domain nuclease of toxin-antitoxin system
MRSINTEHIYGLGRLPDHHKDPFDRMIISQARLESLTVISSDADVMKYPVSLLW